jgi:hypothetical protein
VTTTFIRLDLSSILAGYGDATVAKATLKLYVNAVAAAGSFNVNCVLGRCSEATLTSNLASAIGAATR